MPPTRLRASDLDALLAEGLPEREFRRRLYALEHGVRALKLMEARAQERTYRELYRESLLACLMRLQDRSLVRDQLRSLLHAFQCWRAAVLALAEVEAAMPAGGE